MKFHPLISVPVAALILATTTYPILAAEDATQTVRSANTTLQEFLDRQQIPPAILKNSQGIAIIPNVIQAGFVLGAKRGEGIMLVRNQDGSWSNPAIITLTGGSFGLQVGAKSSDIVLAFQDAESIRKVYNSDFRLGGDVSGTAGPEDSQAVFPTDSTGNIYSYVKGEGLFGGVALSGVRVDYEEDETGNLYGQEKVSAQQVFTGSVTPPPIVESLRKTLGGATASR